MPRKKKIQQPAIIIDPVEAARAAHLHYVSDSEPGIQRQRRGKKFRYILPDGQPLRDAHELDRIKHLAIPPAWADVWICPSPRGHIQATGRDARGRKQYRYHAHWREVRDETKFNRMLEFAQVLPRIRERVAHDLSLPGLPREKVLALVIRLMERTFIRVGSPEYARQNDSFGLTTMHDEHIEVTGGAIQFQFRGKSGVDHTISLKDRRLAAIVRKCRDLPGQHLFQFLDDEGHPQAITSSEVNAYLREITGEDFTAKDFRTWGGTALALRELRRIEQAESETAAKKQLTEVVRTVASILGNTPAVCARYYVHPAVVDAFLHARLSGLSDEIIAASAQAAGLEADEAAVIALLQAI